MKLLKLFLPVGVFAASAAAVLGAQGRLTRTELQNAPVVGALFAAKPVEEHGAAPASEKAPASAHGTPEAPRADGAALAGSFELARPFEAEELEGLVARLGSARESFEKKAQAAAAEREALVRLGQELDERRGEVEKLMSALATERSDLDARRAAFEAQRASLAESEAESLKPLAKTYEEMQPEAAAERLGRLEPEAAAKLLALMRSRKSAKVLEAIEPVRAAELSRRLARLRREAPQGGQR